MSHLLFIIKMQFIFLVETPRRRPYLVYSPMINLLNQFFCPTLFPSVRRDLLPTFFCTANMWFLHTVFHDFSQKKVTITVLWSGTTCLDRLSLQQNAFNSRSKNFWRVMQRSTERESVTTDQTQVGSAVCADRGIERAPGLATVEQAEPENFFSLPALMITVPTLCLNNIRTVPPKNGPVRQMFSFIHCKQTKKGLYIFYLQI